MKADYNINGMHCASCALLIEKKIKDLPNVKSCSVNYATQSLSIETSSPVVLSDLNKRIGALGYSLVSNSKTNSQHGLSELETLKRKLLFILPFTLLVFFMMMLEILHELFGLPKVTLLPQIFKIPLLLTVASLSLFWVGTDYLKGVYRFVNLRVANMDTLVGIGTSVAYFYSLFILFFPSMVTRLNLADTLYFDATIVVIGFITLGKYLESSSKLKTGEAIKKLLGLQAKTALVEINGKEKEISLNKVKVGNIVIVKPGLKVPIDGEIIEGYSNIDESMITGEYMPVSKKVGDTVIGGTLNKQGYFKFRATQVGNRTMLAQIIRLVQEAQGSKAPVQALVDKISAVFVPVVLVIAVLSFVLWLVVGTLFLPFNIALGFALSSLIGTLVIACPCALGLATPTAIIVGTGKGAENGILVKNAEALQQLSKVTAVAFDKTGTITKGKPEVALFKNLSKLKASSLLGYVYSLEKLSEHPLSLALVDYSKGKKAKELKVTHFKNIEGKGISGKINNKYLYIGSPKLVNDLKLAIDSATKKHINSLHGSVVYVFTKKELLGYFVINDEIKKSSKETISELHRLGIKVILLTGDNQKTADFVAKQVKIDEVYAEVLPKDKSDVIKKLQSEGHIVAMVGDGVNDAPALAQSNIGIAMSTGTDVAIESAQVTLLKGDLQKVLKAIKLSKNTLKTIKQNLFWAFIYNVVGIPLAAGAFYPLFKITLNPIFAGMAMALSSVSVVSNSLRLKALKL